MEKSLTEYLLSVKYWVKPLCVPISPNNLLGYLGKGNKLSEVTWLLCVTYYVLCCNILQHFWVFAALIPSWWTIFYHGHPLSFYRMNWSSGPLPGALDWRKFFKTSGEEDGRRCSACFCFLIFFPRSLRNEQALMGEINHHLGSMGRFPPAWSAESGFWTGPVQGGGRDSWLDISRHCKTCRLNMLSYQCGQTKFTIRLCHSADIC